MEGERLNNTKLPEWSFASTVFKGTAEELLEAIEKEELANGFATKEAVEKFLAQPQNASDEREYNSGQ